MIELMKYRFFLILLLGFWCTNTINAQQKKNNNVKPNTVQKKSIGEKAPEQNLITTEELEDYKKKVLNLVSFLEFVLNTVGNDSTAAEDKEIIISRSYLKFFSSSQVQVEDDLDEHRLVKTYKPVQSYLQDVDYFFKYAHFELNVEEVIPYFENVSQPYFKVALTRYIKGKNADGDTVFNSKKRFIEINLDVKQKDIKIASIYTTPLNEEEEQLTWWNSLSQPWKTIFRKEMGGADSLNLGQIKRLQNTQEINISGNKEIMDLSPLNRIVALKSLNISNTNVYDLMPLRNLTSLETLIVDGTLVKNFNLLKYTVNLKKLSFNNTKVDSLLDISKFTKLEELSCAQSGIINFNFLNSTSNLKKLDASNNSIKDLKPLGKLIAMEQLNLAYTQVQDLEVLASLPELQILNISNTPVLHLTHLEGLKKLKKIYFNNTKIQTLAPLQANMGIEKMYCDNTAISKEEILQFMATHSGTLVVFESGQLLSWWKNLTEAWKMVFKNYTKLDTIPSLDQLARLVNEPEIDISGNKDIDNLEPLKVFYNLKILKLKSCKILNLEPIKDCKHLELLDITDNQIKSLQPIKGLANIQLLYCENTPLDSIDINGFRNRRPQCVVVYKTAMLRNWWIDVSDAWRLVFKKYVPYENSPTDEQLHTMIALDSLYASDNGTINTLLPIQKMDRIRTLTLINCRISDLSPLKTVGTLLHLDCSKNPIKDLIPLTTLINLKKLILENTGVSDLEPLATLQNIEHLNLAGTQVKELDDIEKYVFLKQLDISSTAISSLKPVEINTSLRLLKCYNTKLSEKKIAKFKTTNPKCEVVFY